MVGVNPEMQRNGTYGGPIQVIPGFSPMQKISTSNLPCFPRVNYICSMVWPSQCIHFKTMSSSLAPLTTDYMILGKSLNLSGHLLSHPSMGLKNSSCMVIVTYKAIV